MDCYNIVKLMDWLSAAPQEQEKGPQLLERTVEKIEEEGGVYILLRQYSREIMLAQSVDTLRQQKAYL